MRQFLKSVALALFAAALPAAAGTLPMSIPFQGKLIDPATNNPKNGAFSMQFKLYNVPTGGAALFTETQTVTVTNGVFNVQIGTVSVLSVDLFSGASSYLGVTVGADAEMLPRQPLSMSPYAFTAMQLVNPGDVRINSGVAYTTFTTAGNWQFPAGVTAASFSGDGSALTNLPAGAGGVLKIGDTMTGQLTNTSSITVSGGGGVLVVYGLNAGSATLTSGITASSGTFTQTGSALYSLRTSSGINVLAGGVTAPFFAGSGSGLTGLTGSQVGIAGSATYDPANVVAIGALTATFPAAGIAVGDVCMIGAPALEANLSVSFSSASAGNITVRFSNHSVLAVNPASQEIKYLCMRP